MNVISIKSCFSQCYLYKINSVNRFTTLSDTFINRELPMMILNAIIISIFKIIKLIDKTQSQYTLRIT